MVTIEIDIKDILVLKQGGMIDDASFKDKLQEFDKEHFVKYFIEEYKEEEYDSEEENPLI